MPSINDRIGSQNVIRVLSNASAPPSRLLNLTDVDSTSQIDGNLLIWDAGTSKFVMGRDLDGTEGYVFTGGTGNVGIVTFSGTTQSESTLTGAVIISGGLAVGKNANFADGLNVVGIATFSNEIDINAAVDILRGLNVAGVTSVASLNIGATQVISSDRELQNIVSLDATTTATIEAAIVVAPNTFTDLKISGISTFIGIATYAAGLEVFSGVSTFNAAVDIDAGLDVDGQTDLDELVVAGVSTFSAAVDINAGGQANTFKVEDLTDNRVVIVGTGGELEDDSNFTFDGATLSVGVKLDVDGDTQVDDLNVAGVATFSSLVDANARLDVVGGANLDQLNVSGITTLGAVDINGIIDIDGQLDADELVVAGVATFSSLIDANNRLDVVGGANLDQLNVTGVSTLTGNVSFGTSAFFGDNDKINMGDGNDLQIYHASNGTGIIQNAGSGQLQLRSDTIRLLNQATDEDFAFFRDDGAVELYYNNTKRFETSGIGITVTGQLDSTTLNVSGVSTFSSAVDINAGLDVDGDTQVDDLNVAGVATFSSLVDANNRLDVVGGANLDQLNVAGVSTFGNVSIFNDDVRITAGGLDVVGVATFSTNVNVTGTLDAGLIDGGTY